MFKIEALKWVSFWRALKFQPSSWKVDFMSLFIHMVIVIPSYYLVNNADVSGLQLDTFSFAPISRRVWFIKLVQNEKENQIVPVAISLRLFDSLLQRPSLRIIIFPKGQGLGVIPL